MRKQCGGLFKEFVKAIATNLLELIDVFTLKFYNRNWLLDVVMVNPLN